MQKNSTTKTTPPPLLAKEGTRSQNPLLYKEGCRRRGGIGKILKNIFREVWWIYAGINIGVEIDGKHERFQRPVIVVRKFNKDMALIVPITTQDKKANKYYFAVTGDDNKQYTASISQIRAISSKRFFRKIGTIDQTSYDNLLEKLADMVKGKLKNNDSALRRNLGGLSP